MTHHTDAERAEPIKMQAGDDLHLTMLMASHGLNFVTGKDREQLLAWGRDVWQAARRAPAEPVPHGLRKAAQAVVDRWDTPLWKDVPATAVYIADLRAALADAQQPPDSLKRENPATKPEAAPVELPEPVAFVHTPAFVWNGNISPVVSFAKYEDDYKSGIYSLRTPLYTEQQVRELLAAHGIKVNQ